MKGGGGSRQAVKTVRVSLSHGEMAFFLGKANKPFPLSPLGRGLG
jgi:hypothetical protein